MQQTLADYFATIHPWMPIVSKKRMTLGLSLGDGGPDLAAASAARTKSSILSMVTLEREMTPAATPAEPSTVDITVNADTRE